VSREDYCGKGVNMDREKKLSADLFRLLQRLRQQEQECEEKWKKYNEECGGSLNPSSIYLEGVYSGEKSSFFYAAEMLETILICNDVKREGAEDGKARV